MAGLARRAPSGRRPHGHPKDSVVNRYGQSWDIPNLFIAGGSIHPTISGFNPTLTMQALAYMTADTIVGRYVRNRGAVVATVIHAQHTERVARQHGFNGSPFLVGEFVAHGCTRSSSRWRAHLVGPSARSIWVRARDCAAATTSQYIE
jgi:hypothetical protein